MLDLSTLIISTQMAYRELLGFALLLQPANILNEIGGLRTHLLLIDSCVQSSLLGEMLVEPYSLD